MHLFSQVESSSDYDHQQLAANFLQSLSLEESRTWLQTLLSPGSLSRINAYLRRSISPMQTNLTRLKDDASISNTLLVRIGQWNQLFSKAVLLPQGTRFFYTEAISDDMAPRWSQVKMILLSHYTVVQSDGPQSLMTKSWQVQYSVTFSEPLRAIPGLHNPDEWILDRHIKLVITHVRISEETKTVSIEVEARKMTTF